MKKHINIPLFIPHLGCPNQCVFCNQRTISGVLEFDPDSVRDVIEESLSTKPNDTTAEIAFFGGSFTGIERDLMLKLLSIAKEYVDKGLVTSIRCSTRPDYINDEILNILKEYSVNVIELGLQTTNDRILNITKRGHTFSDEERAVKLVVDAGFTLVGQMMIGLPGSTLEDEIECAKFIINSGAKFARIYPTVVFRDTELCYMTEKGEYSPLSLVEATERTATVLTLLRNNGVKVIRVGLCASENLVNDKTYFAGPNHPALGELVENKVYLSKMEAQINEIYNEKPQTVEFMIPKGARSKVIGQKQCNIKKLSELYGIKNIKLTESEGVDEGIVTLIKHERNS